MKKAVLTLSLLFTQLSFGAIENSTLNKKHQDLIEKAILNNCGNVIALAQLSSKGEETRIDQGIVDIDYVSILTGKVKFEQVIYDNYTITVESSYSDVYDHSNKDWGVYTVKSVSCVQD